MNSQFDISVKQKIRNSKLPKFKKAVHYKKIIKSRNDNRNYKKIFLYG